MLAGILRKADALRRLMAERTAEDTILCGANSYVQRLYLNPAFQKLPKSIKRELQILCVSITEKTGGVLVLEFDEAGNLLFKTSAEGSDYLFDDIASGTKIGRARFNHQELLEELEFYYRIVFLGEKI